MKDIETDEEFDEAVREAKIAVVDFYTTWCVPCKFLAPKMEEIEKEYEPKGDVIKFFRADCEKVKKASKNVRSVPTVQFWIDGIKQKEIVIDGKTEKFSVTGNSEKEVYTVRIENLLSRVEA